MTRPRFGALALILAGVLFVLYPALRPWHDESTVAGATAAMSAGAWVASHLFAMLGFILMGFGLLGLRILLAGAGAGGEAGAGAGDQPIATAAVATGWAGVGLTLPYYGAETFGLHAIASHADQVTDLLALVDAVRYQPVAVATFGAGLLLVAAAAVLAAVAVWRSPRLSRYSGVLFALGFVLFLPQFFAPPAVRIGHGVLVAIGSIWLAAAMWRVPGRAHGAAEVIES